LSISGQKFPQYLRNFLVFEFLFRDLFIHPFIPGFLAEPTMTFY
jgi:hypothetical protein